MLLYKDESYAIRGAIIEVRSALGPGLPEKVYQDALEVELRARGIPFEREKHFTVTYRGVTLAHDFFADFVCYGKIIVELKAVLEMEPVFKAQVYTYLRVSGMKLGLLVNFGESELIIERLPLM